MRFFVRAFYYSSPRGTSFSFPFVVSPHSSVRQMPPQGTQKNARPHNTRIQESGTPSVVELVTFTYWTPTAGPIQHSTLRLPSPGCTFWHCCRRRQSSLTGAYSFIASVAVVIGGHTSDTGWWGKSTVAL